MNHRLQHFFLLIVIIPLLAVTAFCSVVLYNSSHERAILKTDYGAVNNITYGLLSVDAWKEHLITIVSNRIDDFEFSKEQELVVKGQIETVLHSVIDKADTLLHAKRKTLRGKVRKAVINTFVNEDKLHARVPEFAQTILNEVKKEENKARLKTLLLAKIREYGAITYDSAKDIARLHLILQKYSAENINVLNEKLIERSALLERSTYRTAIIEIGIVAIFLLLWLLLIKKSHLHNSLFTVSVLLALVILVGGLTAPMIEIDARIKEMSFLLLGEKLVFHDQIIFFQSKSIVDVVHILISNGQWDSFIVGMLIMIFSIVFPIAKLLSSRFYYVSKAKWHNSGIIRFFALKSGKWSMADVYVVAIFMAYIGFKSILDNQLNQLNFKTNSLASISTNETTLQPGFLLFICFVIYGLLLSMVMEKIRKAPKEEGQKVDKSGDIYLYALSKDSSH
ncbi:MAG: paraquat-inducible protein A [Bacteroidota bacterium]